MHLGYRSLSLFNYNNLTSATLQTFIIMYFIKCINYYNALLKISTLCQINFQQKQKFNRKHQMIHSFCSFIHWRKKSILYPSLKSIESHTMNTSLRKENWSTKLQELNGNLPELDASVGLLSKEVIGVCSVLLYPCFVCERKWGRWFFIF